MWITIVLCIVLPPVGLILLWATARNPLRGKLIISIIALLSMTLMLTLFLLSRQQNPYQMQQAPPDYSQLPPLQQSAATPTPAPTDMPTEQHDAAQPEGNVEVIPANPVG